MIEESKFCTDLIKKHFNKELVMTKEEGQYFKNSTVGFVIMHMWSVMLKHEFIVLSQENAEAVFTRDCNINVKLNHKIPILITT